MSSEHYRRLIALMPEPPTDVGEVTAVTAGGCIIALLDGSVTNAKGSASIGDWVYVKDKVIQGQAPDLLTTEIEV